MRKTNVSQTGITRATFEIPRDLYREFKRVAATRERTFSQEVRKLIADEVARDREERAA